MSTPDAEEFLGELRERFELPEDAPPEVILQAIMQAWRAAWHAIPGMTTDDERTSAFEIVCETASLADRVRRLRN